jgi:hypothetical protein
MYRGEIFAYPLFLQEKLASSSPTFFCMDLACKYWPYMQKIIKSCPEFQHLLEMKPFLSVFHAKAHDFKCEVSNHCRGSFGTETETSDLSWLTPGDVSQDLYQILCLRQMRYLDAKSTQYLQAIAGHIYL